MTKISETSIQQLILLGLIVCLGLLLFIQLQNLLPGFLGAITLYILLRKQFFKFVYAKKWNKTATALGLISISMLIITIPVGLTYYMLSSKLAYIFSHQGEFIEGLQYVFKEITKYIPPDVLDQKTIFSSIEQGAMYIPRILSSTTMMLGNLGLSFFLCYFMLSSAEVLEREIPKYIPLKKDSIEIIKKETFSIVISNALGIPIIAVIQGFVGFIGFLIFGLKEAFMWGIITTIFSMIPIIGSAIIWLPLSIYLYATQGAQAGIGLFLFCLILLTNIDNVLRFNLLKKLGNVHPLITVFGVMIGVDLFGFIGLIFGPLLISYFLLLNKIYRIEYGGEK